ncbi:MAG: lipid-A-disaccharide synthase N-terminal domain-containing protein, partial [Planctomycetes bacterium]|nr:lipid-A-disaccharide synthase N-terminal domain-containing protein [Planctomycetota bacterium]
MQWLLSERRGLTHFPLAFWWLSLVGAIFNLVYTGWLGKPMYIAAYLIAWFVPARNLILEYRNERNTVDSTPV